MRKKFFLPLMILVILLSACQNLGIGAQPATPTPAPVSPKGGAVVVEGHLVPRDWTNLFFYAPGKVAEVLVKEGGLVKKGDVLARLGDREGLAAAVTAAELEQAQAQRQVDDLKKNAALGTNQAQADWNAAARDLIKAQQALAVVDTDDYKKRLDDARDKANKTKDDLKTAQEDFDKVKDMDKNNANRKTAEDKLTKAQRDFDQAVRDRDLLISDMDVARGGVELAKARLDNAAATRDARKNGADPADQALADARLKNAKAQLAAAQAALGRADLVAPYDSTVTKVSVSVGEQAMPEQAAIQVADLAKWTVETSDLTEKDVVNVSAGQKVTVVPDALPDLKLTGTVDAIANGFVEKSGDITYMVRIPLETTDPLLRWGMTVNVTFAK
jgi:multidrug resistance efflux pump